MASQDARAGALEPGAYLRGWVASCAVLEKYFRFHIDGFETLRTSESSLLIAYHGGPWPLDVFMLAARMYTELGYFPRTVWHNYYWTVPVLRSMAEELRGLRGAPSDEEVQRLRASGEHLIVLPGGTRESLRPFWRRYQVDFGKRRGYLKLADRRELAIIPVVSCGVEKTFVGLNEGYRFSQRLTDGRAPLWVGLGMAGMWPLALPFPVKITQRIGHPIDLRSLHRPGERYETFLERAHVQVTSTMQLMLDDLVREGRGRPAAHRSREAIHP